MSDPIVYGFPRSTYVNIVRLVLTHKDVPYTFHDLETVMGKEEHLALHPFGRVPVMEHDGFRLYETQAILRYLDRVMPQPSLTPSDLKRAARMDAALSPLPGARERRHRRGGYALLSSSRLRLDRD